MVERINICRTIARERRRMGITQEALAAHLGVSKAAVSKWELGQSLPDVSLLPRIAAYFSLTLDELFDWRDELTEAESAALYAEVYALAETDLDAARERLRALAAEHYSDANLLLMLASLLTAWSAGMASPFAPADATGDADGSGTDGATGAVPGSAALALIDRALEIATEAPVLFLAQQQKATTLFQTGRYEEAVSLLEPLVRRQDAGAPTMLLASAYCRLGRDGDALDLLQMERLRAANFVLSSLAQEMGMRDDATFAHDAGAAATAVYDALGMGSLNPWYPVSMALEEAEALRRAGERDGAIEALARAAMAAGRVDPRSPGLSASPFFDRIADRADPDRVGSAWAEHKARQADETTALMRRAVAERAASPEWRDLAGDDPRYREVVASARGLAGEEASR
ncbi:helix-turn-helix domain-containing protein [Candidatus Collinsella stercoripullorum]|uniref:helix-turn-helix domain-containing protein n=1 Tax=Candidatus Collinsella stercoripullorum TaxID=2838522 RepID=UPI0022DFA4E3|nr:helix-turn-helix transcriptional regulator [Candidatus Collinsella stercoripullorum]